MDGWIAIITVIAGLIAFAAGGLSRPSRTEGGLIDSAAVAEDTSGMDSPIVLGMAVVALLVVVRRFAARRVLARQGRFVWLMFVPTLIGAVVILWAGIQMSASVPIVGVLMVVAGVVYLAVVLRFLTRASHAVNAAGPQDDIGTALTEPLVDYMTTLMGLVLIGGVVALVGLIAWGVTQAR